MPDPDISDPDGSGSNPDPSHLDPAGSGSTRIRIQTATTADNSPVSSEYRVMMMTIEIFTNVEAGPFCRDVKTCFITFLFLKRFCIF